MRTEEKQQQGNLVELRKILDEKSYLKDPKCAECRLRDLPAMACVFCENHNSFQPRSAEVEKAMAYLNSSEGKKKAKQLKQLHNRVAEVSR
jgi:hypothetical protein